MSLSCDRVSEDICSWSEHSGLLCLATELPGPLCSSCPFTHPQPRSLFLFLLSEQTVYLVPGEQGDFLDHAKWPPAGQWECSSFPSPIKYFSVWFPQSPEPSLCRQREKGPASHPLCGLSFWFLLLVVGWVCLFAFLVWGLFEGFICVFVLQCCEFYSGPAHIRQALDHWV